MELFSEKFITTYDATIFVLYSTAILVISTVVKKSLYQVHSMTRRSRMLPKKPA